MKTPANGRWSGRMKTTLIALAAMELALLAAPALLRSTVEDRLGQYLQRKVEIHALSLNPLTLTMHASGVSVASFGGERQLVFDQLQIDANLWGSLRHRGVVIDSVALNRPYLYLARLGENRYNISDLIEKFLNQPKSDEPARFSLNNLTLRQGRIVFDDRPLQTRQDVSQLQLSVPFVSNLPYLLDDPVKPSISGLLNGARFASTARTRPFSQAHESTIDISLDDVDVTHYLGYLPTALRFRIASARLDSKLTLSFSQPPEQAPSIALAGKLGVRGLKLQQPDGTPLLGWQQAELEIARLEPLQQRYRLRRLSLLHPEVWLQRSKNGQFNLQQAFSMAPSGAPASAATPKPTGPALQLALDSLALQQGQLHWQDDRTGFATSLTPIDLQLRQFALKPGQASSFSATLSSDRGERLAAQGQFKLQPFALDSRIEARQLALPHYAPYYRDLLRIRLAGGSLDGQGQLGIDTQGIRLTQLQLGLSDTRLLPPQGKQPFLTLPTLNLQQANIDLAQRKLQIGSIDSSGLQLKLHRNQQGQLDLQQWLAPAAAADTATAKPLHPAAQWTLGLQQLALSDYALDFFDEAPVEDAHIRLSQLQLQARDVSPDKPASVELSTRINRSGQLKLSGTLRPQPLAADLRLSASAIELVPLQPYFGQRLNITLTRGNFSGGGKLRFSAEPQTRFSFAGDARIDRLASLDKVSTADFVNWRALQLDGIAASDSRVAVERIALNDFYARLLVNPNGRLNLLDIVVNDHTSGATSLTSVQLPAASPPATAATPDKAEPFPVRIGKVQLAGGNVQFSDYFIRPNYSANMTQIGGSISGLASAADSRASIDLQGSVNNNAQFTLAGSLNPLAKQLYLDIKAGIKGFEMIPTSPYAGKYAGYGIDKGKLSMDISYFVEQNRLKAQNHLFLDQLTLGDKVDSPDATSLPVRLALSLLQNRRGEIDLNLPIEGSLDDPQFKIGSVIVQVLKNLLEKAVTAPFALLAPGGGEQLSSIEFAPGSAELNAAAQARLTTLATALYDRPALQLEIAGQADAGVDREGLKRQMLEQKIRAQKLRQLARQGQTTDEAQPVSRAEYPALLKAVYQDEDFAKPRNLIGLAKELPLAEMEKLLLDHFDVKPDDLQQLAGRRAFAAKNALIRSGRVEEARLFIVAAKPADNGNRPGSAAGANFTLAGH